MKRMFKFPAIILAVCVIGFCFSCGSGSSPQQKEAEKADGQSGPISEKEAQKTGATAPEEAANMGPGQPVATKSAQPVAINKAIANKNPAINPLAKPTVETRQAPDESTFSTEARGAGFLETRAFKNHPMLLKVEKTTEGRNVAFKVYLKDGRVFDAPPDKMRDFHVIATSTILDAIGLMPKPETGIGSNISTDPKKREVQERMRQKP